jgi:hypothetical protein
MSINMLEFFCDSWIETITRIHHPEAFLELVSWVGSGSVHLEILKQVENDTREIGLYLRRTSDGKMAKIFGKQC